MGNRRVSWVLGIVGLIAAAVSVVGWSAGEQQAQERAARLTLPLAEVVPAPLPTVTLSATVRAQHEVPVAFQASGRLLERKVTAGERVRQSAVLATLDPQDLEAAVAATEAQWAQAEAQRVLAASEWARTQALFAQGFVGAQQRDRARAALEAAEAAVRAAAAQRQQARLLREHAVLRAPRDGVVLGWLAEPGQVVAVGQPVVRLALGDERELEVMLPESLAADAPRTAEAVAPNGSRYPVVWREQEGGVDPLSRTVRSRYRFVQETPAEALLGSVWQVVVPVGGNPSGAFAVPAAALDERGSSVRVWRWAGPDRGVEPVAVQVVRYGEREAVVVGPLSPGERVVAAGTHRLVAGTRVGEAR